MASVLSIDGILFLNENEGERFYSKYFSDQFQNMNQSETLLYEKGLYKHFKSALSEMKDNSDGKEPRNGLISLSSLKSIFWNFCNFFP